MPSPARTEASANTANTALARRSLAVVRAGSVVFIVLLQRHQFLQVISQPTRVRREIAGDPPVLDGAQQFADAGPGRHAERHDFGTSERKAWRLPERGQ